MFCKECGKQIPDDSVFCPECGGKIAEVPAFATAQPAAAAAPAHAATGGAVFGQGMNLGIILGSLIIPFIGIIMGAINLRDPSPAKRKTAKTWLWVGIGAGAFWIMVNLAGACAGGFNY